MAIISSFIDVGSGVRQTLAAGEQMFVTPAGVVGSNDTDAIHALLGGAEIFIAGTVFADNDAIDLDDDDDFNSARVDITSSGVVSGGTNGIVSARGAVSVTNAGAISATQSAIDHSTGDDYNLINHGSITSFAADTVSIGSSNGRVVNFGEILCTGRFSDAVDIFVVGEGVGTAPELFNYGRIASTGDRAISGDSNDPNRFFNFGEIVGRAELGRYNDTFRNGGSIVGNIELDDGDDEFDGRGGTVDGEILGGRGNDTYIVDDINAAIVELQDEGADTVRSMVSFRLGDNLEDLNLIGGEATTGVGNVLANLMLGNIADNVMSGDAGGDTLNASLGKDLLFGGTGVDVLRGQGDDDTVNGDGQSDQVYGGDGNDLLNGGGGNDLVNGGDGTDTANGDAGSDTINGGTGDDTLFGGGGNDIINGQDDNDVMFGGLGSDTLAGGNGADTLDGGTAADRLDGGADDDVLRGGLDANRDTFVFGTNDDRDVAQQFQQGLDDLEFDDLLWGGGLTAAQVVAAFANIDTDGSLVFNFGGGDVFTIDAATSIGALDIGSIASDLVIV